MPNELLPIPLTDEQKAQVRGVLSAGCDWHTAAGFAGCSLTAIRRAMQSDPTFAKDVRRSIAGIELNHMHSIHKAKEDPKNWRASVWWLERHAPERFARNAGTVTARQLKGYIAVLADVIRGGDGPTVSRSEILSRLEEFAESVERLLRSEQLAESATLGLSRPEAASIVISAESVAEFDYDESQEV